MGHREGMLRRGCAGFRRGLTVEEAPTPTLPRWRERGLDKEMRAYCLRLIEASLN